MTELRLQRYKNIGVFRMKRFYKYAKYMYKMM